MNLLFCAAPCNVYAFLTTEAYPSAFAPFLPTVPGMPDYIACIDNNWHPANANGLDALILRLFTGSAYTSSMGFKMNNVNIVDIGLRIIKAMRDVR
jgi:hypothetical protein